MNKILKEETGYRGKIKTVAYLKKYVLRRVSSDGLLKHHEDVSKYDVFNTEDEAFEFCASRGIEEVVILPFVQKDHFPD